MSKPPAQRYGAGDIKLTAFPHGDVLLKFKAGNIVTIITLDKEQMEQLDELLDKYFTYKDNT